LKKKSPNSLKKRKKVFEGNGHSRKRADESQPQHVQTAGLDFIFHGGGRRGKGVDHRTGNPARKAAGKIHSDIERGFIRAEVVEYHDFYDWEA
jgi:ribosome-binding ATPase YchF (GTP1/OBG family)